MPLQLRDVVRRLLIDPEAGWSMGGFGAIAEFHQDPGEVALVDNPDQLTRATARGAIRIDPEYLGRALPLAYEIPSSNPRRWSHAIALCFQTQDAKRNERGTLTELGADHDAIRVEDRQSVLFDMGLGLVQADFCIRTSDPDLLGSLRAAVGRSIFDATNPAMSAILEIIPTELRSQIWGASRFFRRSAAQTLMASLRQVLTLMSCRSSCGRVVPIRRIHRYPMDAPRLVHTSILAILSSVHSVRTVALTLRCMQRFKHSWRPSVVKIFSTQSID